jgi:hypothetical protein
VLEAGHEAVQTVTPSPQSVSEAERQQPAVISSMNVLWLNSFSHVLSCVTYPEGQDPAAVVLEAGHAAVQTVTPLPQSVSDAERQQPAIISSISVL